jgi:hypothetical protein
MTDAGREAGYSAAQSRAEAAVSDKLARGNYGGAASIEARMLATHQPLTKLEGEPCDACGQAWPCGVVQSIPRAFD